MRADPDRVADLLHEAAETHHRVDRITDGEDPDWAIWYANWLIELSELPELLGRTPVRSELICLLVLVDREVTERRITVPWQDYYARRIAQHFATWQRSLRRRPRPLPPLDPRV